jgi:hypothetical protein
VRGNTVQGLILRFSATKILLSLRYFPTLH